MQENEFDQPIGDPLNQWEPPMHPPRSTIEGVSVRLEPLSVEKHAEALFSEFTKHGKDEDWTYLPYGPFSNAENFSEWMRVSCEKDDPQFYTVILLATGTAVGMASYLRIKPEVGCIEVGHIHYSNTLRQSRAATEVMFLMMQQVFDLGYRRYEWKCDDLNEPSKSAARRLGFQFEGVFKQAAIYKGRNRDTAWFSIVDQNWETMKPIYETWLASDNFDKDGQQKQRLTKFY